jgi:predicted dehydrogenase
MHEGESMSGLTNVQKNRKPVGPHIGIGVVGYGFMGKVHSNAYLKIPYSFTAPAAYPELRAVCARDAQKTASFAERFGYVGYYTDWKELVHDSEISVVDICTPDNEHFAPSVAAAEAGKHVICEKPLAMTVQDARAMWETAQKAGVKHMLCHNYRFIPAIRLAKDLVERGVLGKIYHFRGRYLQEAGHDPGTPLEDCWYAVRSKSGVLLGLGSHIIDMARFLIGEIVAVNGLMKTYNASRKSRGGGSEQVSSDESCAALVEFENGSTGVLEASAVATGRKNQQTWEINGSRGSITFDLEDLNHLQVYTEDAAREIRGFSGVSVTDPEHPLQTIYLPAGHNAGWEYGHLHALHHFLDCVAHGKPVQPRAATFEDGYRIQVIMKAISDSSASGRRILLEY